MLIASLGADEAGKCQPSLAGNIAAPTLSPLPTHLPSPSPHTSTPPSDPESREVNQCSHYAHSVTRSRRSRQVSAISCWRYSRPHSLPPPPPPPHTPPLPLRILNHEKSTNVLTMLIASLEADEAGKCRPSLAGNI